MTSRKEIVEFARDSESAVRDVLRENYEATVLFRLERSYPSEQCDFMLGQHWFEGEFAAVEKVITKRVDDEISCGRHSPEVREALIANTIFKDYQERGRTRLQDGTRVRPLDILKLIKEE